MDNVASAIERQHPKSDIQLEKSNTQIMHYKGKCVSCPISSWVFPNSPAAYTKIYNIVCYHWLEIIEPQCPSAEILKQGWQTNTLWLWDLLLHGMKKESNMDSSRWAEEWSMLGQVLSLDFDIGHRANIFGQNYHKNKPKNPVMSPRI